MTGYHHHPRNIDRKILDALWNDQRMGEIARSLHLPMSTFTRIRRQLFQLAGARTAVGLVRYALKEGWLKP